MGPWQCRLLRPCSIDPNHHAVSDRLNPNTTSARDPSTGRDANINTGMRCAVVSRRSGIILTTTTTFFLECWLLALVLTNTAAKPKAQSHLTVTLTVVHPFSNELVYY